jgi:hypothetical protein
MHLTYRDSNAHTDVVSGASALEAGAPDSSEMEALETAYSHWHGRWAHALDLGGFGDLRELRDALMAACPKA